MNKNPRENSSIRVLVVDDHAIIRKGIRAMLEIVPDIELVGEAENGIQAVQLDRELHPDVILIRETSKRMLKILNPPFVYMGGVRE